MATSPEPPTAPAPPAGMVGSLGPLFRIVKDQRIAFLLVGATNTVIGTGWFVFFEMLVGHRFGYISSLLMAHVAAVLCAFWLYRWFVFRVHGHVWRDLARFEVVNLTSLGINLVCLPFVVEVVGLSPIPAQLLITLITMMVSFFGHKRFSFRRTPEEVAADARPTAQPSEGEKTP